MNKNEKEWQQFLDSHEDIVKELSDEDFEEIVPFEKQFGMTLFSGEPNGHFMVFNTQIDIFQFVDLLREFFGIEGVDVGHANCDGHHFHDVDDEDENDDS